MIAGLSVASPAWLLLLLLLPLLLLLARRDTRRRQRRIAAWVDAGLQTQMVQGVSSARRGLLSMLGLCGWALMIVALAQPQCEGKPVLLPKTGVDILYVVDVSRSMRARDVLPDRLERAKAEIGASLAHLGDNRIGVVAFAGTAFVQCPLTTDAEAVRLFLNELRPETVPQGGTDLAAGLEVAHNAFLAEQEANPAVKHADRVIVVITDGEDHEGGLEEIGKALKDAGTSVFFIGVGGGLGEPIPKVETDGTVTGYLKDRTGQTILSKMRPDVLLEVAKAVGGTFIDGTRLPDLGLSSVESAVTTMEKRDLEARTRTEKIDQSVLFAALALPLLLLWLAVPERARRATGVAP